MNKLLYNLI